MTTLPERPFRSLNRALALCSLLAATISSASQEAYRKPLDIGSSLQLVADTTWQEALKGGAQRKLHHPERRELINDLCGDDGSTYRYMTVFMDEGIYRMYYGLIKVAYEEGKLLKEPERICYAESKDGIQWYKPTLRLFEYKGSWENNIVWMEDGKERFGVSGFSVFRDSRPDCPPEERYKAVAEAGPLTKAALGHNGLLGLVSPDGIQWKMVQPEPIMTGGPGRGNFDTQNLAFWDATREEYRLYRREVYREGTLGVFRDILTSTSKDFRSWSAPVRLQYPGATPEQLYTNNIQPYFRAPHLYVGFPVRYVQRGWSESIAQLPENKRRQELIRAAGAEPTWKSATEAGGQRIGTALTDALFMISRDGVKFQRWDEAFIRPGLRSRNNWFYGDNFPAWGLVATASTEGDSPEELSFYVTEGARRGSVSNQCRRYTLRMDGFISVNAPLRGGEVISHPLVFSGSEMHVNFSASAAGGLKVEIQDESGEPLPGFELEKNIELLGDGVKRKVQWGRANDLRELTGKAVKIRFVLRDADLYSFQVE